VQRYALDLAYTGKFGEKMIDVLEKSTCQPSAGLENEKMGFQLLQKTIYWSYGE
jgi:hypothetical protein